MTRKLLLFAILISGLGASAQNGYEIQVTLKPFKDQYIYPGHYFGKTYPIIFNPGATAGGFMNFAPTDLSNSNPLWDYAETLRWRVGPRIKTL